jgi:hypothetical protein
LNLKRNSFSFFITRLAFRRPANAVYGYATLLQRCHSHPSSRTRSRSALAMPPTIKAIFLGGWNFFELLWFLFAEK